MILHFIFIVLTLFLTILLLFLIGNIILKYFVQEVESIMSTLLIVFLNIFIGLITVILIYSFCKSSFHTINILFLPLIIYLTFTLKIKIHNYKIPKKKEFKGMILFFFFSFLVFSLQFSFYYNFKTNSINKIFIDNYFYSEVVKNLNYFGSENIFYTLNKFLPEFRTELFPYRYADLWFSSFIMDIFSLNPLESFYLITSPLIISLLVFFLFYITSLRVPNFYISILISIVISFSSILFIPILNPSDKLIYLSETTIMGVFKQKTALSALFFTVGLYFFYKNQTLSIVLFLFIPLLYVAYLPAIWGGSGVYFIISYILSLKKEGYFNIYLKYMVLLIFMIFLFYIFFMVFGTFFRSLDSFDLKKVPIIKRLFSGFGPDLIVNLKVFFKDNLFNTILYVFKSTKNLIFGFVFIFPLWFFIFKEMFSYKKLVLYVSCLLMMSFLMVVLRDGYGDNDQFFTNTLVFLSLFFSFVFLETVIAKNIIKTFIYLFIVLIFCLIPVLKIQYSSHVPVSNESFLKKVSTICNENKINTIFCVISDFESNTAYYKTSTKNILIPIVNSFNDISFSIANPEIFKINNQKIDFNLYGNLINHLRTKNKGLNDIEIYKKFNIIAFLYYPKSKIPQNILLKSRKILKDKSGFIFVLL